MQNFKVIIVEDVPLELKGTQGIIRNEIPEAEIIGTADNEASYWKLMKQEVTVDRNKTVPRCGKCCYYHPEFKYRRCLYATCPYGKQDSEVFRHKPLKKDKFPHREVVI